MRLHLCEHAGEKQRGTPQRSQNPAGETASGLPPMGRRHTVQCSGVKSVGTEAEQQIVGNHEEVSEAKNCVIHRQTREVLFRRPGLLEYIEVHLGHGPT